MSRLETKPLTQIRAGLAKETREEGAAIERHANRRRIKRRYKVLLGLADKAIAAGSERECEQIQAAAQELDREVSYLDKRIARYRKAKGGLE
jgi:hypothetical protein